MISRRSIFWLLLILAPFVLAACSNTSGSLGQAHQGRILLLTVLQVDETDELRYSTIDTNQVLRHWRMQPSEEGNELVLMRFKVENHIAVNTVLVFDDRSVVLRDFFQNDFRPLSVTDSIYLDQRGQGDATVNLSSGQCFDHPRLVVNAGTNVQWINIQEPGTDVAGTSIQFDPGVFPTFGDAEVLVEAGASLSQRFDQPGTFDYRCSGADGVAQRAQVLVEGSGSVRPDKDRNILFLEGDFNLPQNNALDGWMVFELPRDTKIRDLRWRAGDSITIRF